MITVDGLCFSYKKSPVFSKLDWSVRDGSILGLLGKNGAGKSTLLRLVSGILRQDKGIIKVDGMQPFDRKADFLSDIFFLPEDCPTEHISAVRYARRYGCFYPHFDMEHFLEHMDMLETDSRADMHKMSFGQRKKTMLSFSLSLGVKHLLLDEPSNGLDISSRAVFRELLKRYSDPMRTVILSTHQIPDLEAMADNVSILHEGKISFNGNVSSLSSIDPSAGTDLEKFFIRLTKSTSIL